MEVVAVAAATTRAVTARAAMAAVAMARVATEMSLYFPVVAQQALCA